MNGLPSFRRKPLRRVALKAATVDQVRAWQRKPRKAIARIGRKAKRERASIAAFRKGVKAQASGLCEGFVHGLCLSMPHDGEHPHHIWPEDRRAGRHEVRRGAWLCFVAHRWVHDNPAKAAEIGLLRPDLVEVSTGRLTRGKTGDRASARVSASTSGQPSPIEGARRPVEFDR